jgi:hypothetical protein
MSVPKNLKKRKKERGRRERLLEDWPPVVQMIDASYASWGLFPQIFRGFSTDPASCWHLVTYTDISVDR